MTGGRGRPLPVAAIWLMLVGASLAGFALAEGLAHARIAATAAVLLAGLKMRLVVSHYMEVGWNTWPLRMLLELWLLTVMTILLAGYWLA